jgi:hypothetical protein
MKTEKVKSRNRSFMYILDFELIFLQKYYLYKKPLLINNRNTPTRDTSIEINRTIDRVE